MRICAILFLFMLVSFGTTVLGGVRTAQDVAVEQANEAAVKEGIESLDSFDVFRFNERELSGSDHEPEIWRNKAKFTFIKHFSLENEKDKEVVVSFKKLLKDPSLYSAMDSDCAAWAVYRVSSKDMDVYFTSCPYIFIEKENKRIKGGWYDEGSSAATGLKNVFQLMGLN